MAENLTVNWKDCCFSEGMDKKGAIVFTNGVSEIESYEWKELEHSLVIQPLMSMRKMKTVVVK